MSLAQVSILSLKSHTQLPALYLILHLLDIGNWTTEVISFSALHFPTPPVLREEAGTSTYKVTQVRNWILSFTLASSWFPKFTQSLSLTYASL